MTPFVRNSDRVVYQVAFTPVEEVSWIFCVTNKVNMNAVSSQYFDVVLIFDLELFL